MMLYKRDNEDVASLQNQNAGDSIGLCNCVCPVLDRYVEDSELFVIYSTSVRELLSIQPTG